MLNQIFSAFDDLAEKLVLEKNQTDNSYTSPLGQEQCPDDAELETL